MGKRLVEARCAQGSPGGAETFGMDPGGNKLITVRTMTWTRERVAYLVVGLGVGALLDGFILHQVLQWHHLWSQKTTVSTVRGLEQNTLADGVFHMGFLVVLLIGIGLLIGRRIEARPLAALVLIGWGCFHVIDQFVFHLTLKAHHIREGVENPEVYDWTFFAIGLVLIAIGTLVLRSADAKSP
jgi:uncharacterized membrane protein